MTRYWVYNFTDCKISLISCNILPVISEQNGVLLEIEWEEIFQESKFERIVSVYHRTDVLDLQVFIPDKFNLWLSNGRCVEDIWKNCKYIFFKDINRYVTQKGLWKNGHFHYYIKE